MITQSTLKELLHYDLETGIFIWAIARGNRKANSIAGTKDKDGYIVIKINSTQYKAHRLAFLYMTGKFPNNDVDHINGSKDDNSWINLREVTRTENNRNSSILDINKSGTTGVHFDKATNKWRAQIGVNKKTKSLGYFNDLKDAVLARKNAEIKYGYHENHGKLK